ncbi:MAG: hypothetical protein J7549_10905 [Variovorax sp.]|nr:hypothetical protein [Variovorax sp.]
MPLSSLSNRERCVLSLFALLLLIAVAGPAVPVSGLAGAPFADAHPWGVLPNAMDVLSNLPFAAIGLWGLRWLRWLDRAHEAVLDAAPHARAGVTLPVNALDCAWMFFAGLILTAVGSAFYHLQPDSVRLAADRAGMAVAFAGLVGMAICERVSARAGWPAAWFTLAGGLLAAAVCHQSGNALPWALVQFGGMALVLLLAFAKPVSGAIGLKLGWVIFFYALAKLFELADHAIFDATHHLVSGHSLKHLTAALAALPVLHALQAMGRQALRHNPGVVTVTA